MAVWSIDMFPGGGAIRLGALLAALLGASACESGASTGAGGGRASMADAATGPRDNGAGTRRVLETSTSGAPGGRIRHSAVWTGTEMIVWGGTTRGWDLGDGGAYDPAGDRWRPVEAMGAPSSRSSHTATWTGSEMIVWGGSRDDRMQEGRVILGDGAAYDPTTGRWRTLSVEAAPSARAQHTAVWTGSEMIIWGGHARFAGLLPSGGTYDPTADLWRPISPTGAPEPRFDHAAVWAGSEMIVWGGVGNSLAERNPLTATATGGRYAPATDAWQPMPREGAPNPRTTPTAIFTGTEVIVWGGVPEARGGRFDPVTSTWSTIAASPPIAPQGASVTWTGKLVVAIGSGLGDHVLAVVYDPTLDGWAQVPGFPPGFPRASVIEHTAVWTGTEVVVFGGFNGVDNTNRGARYRP